MGDMVVSWSTKSGAHFGSDANLMRRMSESLLTGKLAPQMAGSIPGPQMAQHNRRFRGWCLTMTRCLHDRDKAANVLKLYKDGGVCSVASNRHMAFLVSCFLTFLIHNKTSFP